MREMWEQCIAIIRGLLCQLRHLGKLNARSHPDINKLISATDHHMEWRPWPQGSPGDGGAKQHRVLCPHPWACRGVHQPHSSTHSHFSSCSDSKKQVVLHAMGTSHQKMGWKSPHMTNSHSIGSATPHVQPHLRFVILLGEEESQSRATSIRGAPPELETPTQVPCRPVSPQSWIPKRTTGLGEPHTLRSSP